MPDKMLVLTLAHNIFLTKEERYKIANLPGSKIITVGVCVPVWCLGDVLHLREGLKTSEPGEEIFCRYIIDNMEAENIIDLTHEGYHIHLSTMKTRKKLLNVIDGGAEGCNFSSHTKLNIVSEDHSAKRCIHFVNISDISILENSLT